MRPALNLTLRDRSGAVAPGASAFFYIRGTTTQWPVYAAASGGSPLTQPVASDAAGQISVFAASRLQFDIVSTINGEAVTQHLDAHAAGNDGWTNATLQNGFAASGSYPVPAYTIDTDGMVLLRGAAGTPGVSNTAIFTLPAGYRPSERVMFPIGSFGSTVRCDISSAGLVTPSAGAGVWFLDGIRFLP